MEEKNTNVEQVDKGTIGYEQLDKKIDKKFHNIFFNIKLYIVGVLVIILVSLIFLGLYHQKKTNEIIKIQGDVHTKMLLSDHKGVIETAEKGLNKEPENKYLLIQALNAFANQGNETGKEKDVISNAQKMLSQANKMGEEDPDVLNAIGYVYEVSGNYARALEIYKKASEVNGKNALSFFHLGHIYEFYGRKDIAYGFYEKAYSLDPKDPLILIAKGRESYSNNDFDGAYKYFIEASKLPNIPNNIESEALSNASIARRANIIYLGDALTLSKNAITIDPSYAPAYGTHAYNLMLNVQKKESLAYATKATELNPRISTNYWIIGRIYLMDKKYNESILYFNKALEKINEDNTILGSSEKDLIKGTIAYDLAKTYYYSDKKSRYIIPTLEFAASTNSNVKGILKKDNSGTSHLFNEQQLDPKFLQLIK